jgi:hypothetical protein
VGNVKEQIRRLEELQSLGVSQFNIYLMVGDEEKQVAAYGSKVIPHFNGAKKNAKAAKKNAKLAKGKAKPAKKAARKK